TSNLTINNFTNGAAATMVPVAAMLGSHQVRTATQTFPPGALAGARPLLGEQPLRPDASTQGVTPAVARQFNLAPRQGGAGWRAARGPVRRVPAPAPTSGPPRPPLLGPRGEPPGVPHVGVGVAPDPGGSREPVGPPPLVVPGGRPPGSLGPRGEPP